MFVDYQEIKKVFVKMNYKFYIGKAAKERLVEYNMKLVIHIAKYYRYR